MLPKGIGGKTPEQALADLHNMTLTCNPIGTPEYLSRIAAAQNRMRELGISALYVNAGTNLSYFTGLDWYASERLVGAILPEKGDIQYIAPAFERGSIEEKMVIPGVFHGWQEHESPYALCAQLVKTLNLGHGKLAIDESTAFFIANGLQRALPTMPIVDGSVVTAHCRMHKSEHELALIQRAMDMTLTVHKAAASILREGMSTTEVEAFIHEAHKKVGASSGSYFCIVLFGGATAFPHGVKNAQVLKPNDLVLIDTGCRLHGYLSDITRTYCFGRATEKQKILWQAEKNAQLAAFHAATLGASCGSVDAAARSELAKYDLGPEYDLPGLPHRTGHGIGMDIHEWPYLVKDNPHQLAAGMCFSNEPMIVVPGEFGIRLEDHFYMTESGPVWFTRPAHSLDDPFHLQQ
ncbi:Xaa-Pro peptidase family protein [Aestuariibacter sp. A3R04]|uniref:M24 family metallopeptidase n=1 Tax=Aestuariibacter sp. A3R04 TaxID=2841571 RepID=UPI001C08BBFD|nr:Xaa-Pro peptidase family protein [Aestuariibacter sp. A3R04]MBU3020856.1 Xaa-Pro peptidase family protein [Aestuariibacter sp. A3R04]